MPQPQYDRIEKGLVRVSRYIKRHFAQSEHLSQRLGERGSNGKVDVRDLKSFIVDACRDELISRDLSKRDIEAFLSAFNYNHHGTAEI